MTMPGVMLSHTHIWTYRHEHFKGTGWLSHLVVLCEGSPRSGLANLKYSHSSTNPPSFLPRRFHCLCGPAAVTHACSAGVQWTTRSVFLGSSRKRTACICTSVNSVFFCFLNHFYFTCIRLVLFTNSQYCWRLQNFFSLNWKGMFRAN